jgi:hypothetical protein
MRPLLSVVVIGSLLAASCNSGEQPLETAYRGLQRTPALERQWRLPYGPATGELGLREPSKESRAWGPQAATISSTGELVVLDNEKGRVVSFDSHGRFSAASPQSAMTLDVACSVAICWFLELTSPTLTERAGVHGEVRGRTSLSAAFKTVVGIGVVGGEPTLHTAYQESYLPLTAQPLATRRNGLLQSSGAALSLSLNKQLGTMTLHEEIVPLLDGSARRTREVYSASTDCDAMRLVGSLSGNRLVTVCDVVQGGIVERAVLLLDFQGAVVQRIALSPDILYVPFRQVRLVADQLLLLEPLPEYLQITLLSLGGMEGDHE